MIRKHIHNMASEHIFLKSRLCTINYPEVHKYIFNVPGQDKIIGKM